MSIKKEKSVKHFELLKQRLGDFKNYEYFGQYIDLENTKKNNFMKNIELNYDIEYPMIKYVCICNHAIKRNCYIRNKETKEIIVMGSCCVMKFEVKKACFNCNKKHGRTKSNICIECENEEKKKIKELKKQQKQDEKDLEDFIKKIKKNEKIKKKLENTIITFGKHKMKTIKYLYENEINYFNWCLKQYEENNNTMFNKIVEYNELV